MRVTKRTKHMWRQWSVLLLVGALCTWSEAHTRHQSGRSAEAALAHHLQQQPSAYEEEESPYKEEVIFTILSYQQKL